MKHQPNVKASDRSGKALTSESRTTEPPAYQAVPPRSVIAACPTVAVLDERHDHPPYTAVRVVLVPWRISS